MVKVKILSNALFQHSPCYLKKTSMLLVFLRIFSGTNTDLGKVDRPSIRIKALVKRCMCMYWDNFKLGHWLVKVVT